MVILQPEWFALVARAEFFFNDVQNEALAEQLRELKRYYEENGRPLDFFFVSEPAWLAKYQEAVSVKRPCVALVSTDKQWITYVCIDWPVLAPSVMCFVCKRSTSNGCFAIMQVHEIEAWSCPETRTWQHENWRCHKIHCARTWIQTTREVDGSLLSLCIWLVGSLYEKLIILQDRIIILFPLYPHAS